MDKQEKLRRVAEIMAELEELDVDVKLGKKEEQKDTESLVIEKADSGKGFQLYRDYGKIDKATTKLKRLVK